MLIKNKLIPVVRSLASLLFLLSNLTFAQNKIQVLVDKPIAEVQPTMWGVFFEDINFAADGGIYAELIKNRSFEFYKPMMGWKEVNSGSGNGKTFILNKGNENLKNPRYVRLVSESQQGSFGILNEGFRGIGIKKGAQYNFSVIARRQGVKEVKLKIELLDSSANKVGETFITGFTDEWKQYKASFVSSATNPKGKLRVSIEGKGSLDMDMISLFPQDTWKQRPNGMRADIVQMLADLKPGFIRFPGGCIVEGHELSTRYQWKKTVGAPEDRELIVNRWNSEFSWRPAPDYFQTSGLGFFEYFQLAEDLKAEPLPILSCGIACQYNTGELVPMNQLDPYIQDAIDLIEFANGSADSKWGKLRTSLGHPQPFNLKFIGIGNEQWGEQYIERYKEFAKAIHKKYPEIKLVSGAGPSPDGDKFDYLWSELKKADANIVDEHYYKEPEWFLKSAKRYDDYDRKGPKIFAGEYAAHADTIWLPKKSGSENNISSSRNTLQSALAEAAFMTGLERNSDAVYMTSYAPLLAHVEAWQWRPDLIWFDNLNVVGTPNYYVQKLFSTNKGTHSIPVLQNGAALTGQDSLYASATIDKDKKELLLKFVNTGSKSVSVTIQLNGKVSVKPMMKAQILSAKDPYIYNSIENPVNIIPVEKEIKVSGRNISYTVEGNSLNVLKIAL